MLLSGSGLLRAQNRGVTAPIGYRTETLEPGLFNLLSSNLNSPVAAAGDFDSVGGSTLTDTDVDFSALLSGDSLYTVKVTSGGGEGFSTVVFPDSLDPGTLFTVDDLAGAGVTAGDSYEVRPTQTISDLFGSANEAGLQTGNFSQADRIWNASDPPFITPVSYVQDDLEDSGISSSDWQDGAGQSDEGDSSSNVGGPSPSISCLRRHVDTPRTTTKLEGDGFFNYLSRVLPVEVTLDDSGLQTSLDTGDPGTADIVWVPAGGGEFNQYFFDEMWREIQNPGIGCREHALVLDLSHPTPGSGHQRHDPSSRRSQSPGANGSSGFPD